MRDNDKNPFSLYNAFMAMAREHNTRVNAAEIHGMRRVIDQLTLSPTPVKTVTRLIARSNGPRVTPFERYIGMALRDAGGEQLAAFPPQKAVHLVPPSEGHLVQLVCATEPTTQEASLLQSVESTINRLCCIVDAIEDSADFGSPAPAPGERTITISLMGGGFLPERPGYRSAHVLLPEIGSTEQPDIAYLNEVDWRTMDHVAAIARPVFQSTMLPNMHRSFMGGFGPNGSDWDVRTRLAGILGKLELSARLICRFDCDTHAGSVSVRFIAPSAAALPQRVVDEDRKILAGLGDRAPAACMAYLMRLACLLGAACFGSGRHIERAFIAAVREGGSETVLSCSFNRAEFVKHTMTAIDDGALSDPSLRFNPRRIADIMAPERIDFADLADPQSFVAPPDDGMDANRIPVPLDTRPLPEDMANLFHAKRICDLDTRHENGTGRDVVERARDDSDESIVAAIAHLENLVDKLEGTVFPPDDDADSRPLYCPNPLSRAMVSLLDEELAVGDQAEAFLANPQLSDTPNTVSGRLPRYFRAPAALFDAYMGLSDLYGRLGDFKGAEARADRCIQLAPTSAQAYFRKADILAQLGRYTEAVNVIFSGLRTAIASRDCALLYYHLGLLLWKMGRKRDAAAVQVYASAFDGELAVKARTIIRNLRKRSDSAVVVHASPLAASREMARARIPVAPSDSARTLVVQAAIGLTCANAPLAAAPYAAAMAGYFKDDPIVAGAAASIIHGTSW